MRILTVLLFAISLVFAGAVGAVAQEMPAAAPAPAAAPEAPAPPPPAVNVGDAVQPWEAKIATSGEMVTSSALTAPYALVFVNSSCSSCRAELGTLSKRRKLNLDVYVVAVDSNVERAIMIYQDKLKLEFPILDGSDFTLANKFDFGSTPATVIVKDGKVDYRAVGFTPRGKDELMAAFDKF